MKKILVLFLMFFALIPLFNSVQAETENFVYNFDFADNYEYDLLTGQLKENINFAVTSREILGGEEVIINSLNYANYILFWNSSNSYIGYYILNGSIENAKYLGDVTLQTFTVPEGSKKIAFLINKYAEDSYSGLGGYTYSDIFENPVMADYVIDSQYLVDEESYSTLEEVFGNALHTLNNTARNSTVWGNFLSLCDTLGIDKITLENLIVNGDFATDISNWNLFATNKAVFDNGTALQETSGVSGATYTQYANITGNSIYFYGEERRNSGANASFYILPYEATSGAIIELCNPACFNALTVSQWYNFSDIVTLTNDGFRIVFGRSSPQTFSLNMDNIMAFNLGAVPIYTETQIDDLIAYFGYFEGEAIFPDLTDEDLSYYFMYYNTDHEQTTYYDSNVFLYRLQSGTQLFETRDEAGFNNYIDIYHNDEYNSTTNLQWGVYFDTITTIFPTDLNDNFVLEEEDIYITDLPYRDYYINLFWDYMNEHEDRFEWFIPYGITVDNYTEYLNIYTLLLDETATDYSDLVQLEAYTEREILVPEHPTITNFWAFIDDLDITDLGFIAITLILLIICVVLFAIKKSPISLIILICGFVLLLAITLEWFAVWLALLFVIILFIADLFLIFRK